ncbi:MAG: SDR family NAD(P)-dependent oxidoreductase, partial [Acidimicrobiales bacterium]
MKVDGASVLLTGASSGIGAALAPMLAEAGARVALVARREDRLLEVLERCQPYAPGSQIWICDLDDPGAAEECALEVEGAFGAVDILINNAAIPKRRKVTDLSVAEFQQTMRVNLESPVRMTLAVLPGMLARDRGVIVNVASMGGRIGILQEAAYCASKFAL